MTASVRGFGILQSDGAAVNTHVIPTPNGVTKGDLLIMFLAWQTSTSMTTVPDGWSIMTDLVGTNVRGTFFMKYANNNEPADYTFVQSNIGGTLGAIVAIQDPGPIHLFEFAQGTSETPTCPDITLTDSCLVLRIYVADDNDITTDTGYPAGTTGVFIRQTTMSTDTYNKSGGLAYETAAAGATGTAAFTMDLSEPWIALTLAIELATINEATVSTTDLNRTRVTY
jgi:hypothetical protein